MAGDQNNPKNALSYEAITRALFETYESIYDIDVKTSAYQCYHESDAYSELQIESSGQDFFKSIACNVPQTVYHEDVEYALGMLRRTSMLSALKKDKYYDFVYRLMLEGKPVYHKARATMEKVNGRPHILLGIRNVDETIRQEKAHTEALAYMYQKEKNHMEAILASAAGYIEANLTKDIVLEKSVYLYADYDSELQIGLPGESVRYSDFMGIICKEQVVKNADKFAFISDRNYLISCFERGEKRASVSFSIKRADEEPQPCSGVFYLYRDDGSGDIIAFLVVYDLTEQQRREKELEDLEDALKMSRIRNSTSQMQPHFLYNALGSIQEIVMEDPEYASQLIGDFTVHLRSCVRAMSSDAPIPFAKELENIRAYVNIEKMRFGDKLKIVWDIKAEDFSILPLSIQPLVENAIRHGIYERGAKGGTVTIHSRENEKAWIVEVEDDGVGFEVELLRIDVALGRKDSTGLENIKFRLDKVMNSQVEVSSAPGIGTKVTVTIPKPQAR